MQLSEQQKDKLVQYIIDLYKNGLIDNVGKFTDLGDNKQKEFVGRSFIYCLAGEPQIGKAIEENNLAEVRRQVNSIWLLFDKDNCSWNWLFILLVDSVINNNDKFEAILALNRKMFGIETNKTSLEKAAELLDDSDEFEDI